MYFLFSLSPTSSEAVKHIVSSLAAKKMRNICGCYRSPSGKAKQNIHLNRFIYMHTFPFIPVLYGNENSNNHPSSQMRNLPATESQFIYTHWLTVYINNITLSNVLSTWNLVNLVFGVLAKLAPWLHVIYASSGPKLLSLWFKAFTSV